MAVNAPSSDTLLSDELLRHLMAVGQVDVLVGLPTLNNADTVGGAIRAVHAAFTGPFARDRTVLIHSDGGSDDGTAEAARAAIAGDADLLTTSHPLRTVHRLAVPYHGLPGRARALRTILAAADLLQAKALVVLDPELSNVDADRVAALVRPVYREGVEFLAPAYRRHPLEAPLLTQLVRPLVRAAYVRPLSEPLAVEYACSRRLVTAAIESDAWSSDLVEQGPDLWLAASALAGDYACAEVHLPRRLTTGSTRARPGLPETFRQVVGSLFACLELHGSQWLDRSSAEPLRAFGTADEAAPEAPGADPAPMAEAFRSGARDLAPILARVLEAATLARVEEAAGGDAQVPDDLWCAIVYEFAGAYVRGAMHRDHLVQALVPLYLGRAASFLGGVELDPPGDRDDALGRRFESCRADLVERWRAKREVSHG